MLRVFTENNEKLRELLFAAIPKIGPQPEDVCATALRGAANLDSQPALAALVPEARAHGPRPTQPGDFHPQPALIKGPARDQRAHGTVPIA